MTSEARKVEAHQEYSAAMSRAENGDLDAAVEAISRAIDLWPRSTFWVLKAEYLYDLRRPFDAKDAAQRALELGPRNFHAHNLLGLVHGDSGDFRKAADHFEHSVELEPDHNVHTLLATAQAEFDLEKAANSARKALELELSWEEARALLHKIETRMKATDIEE